MFEKNNGYITQKKRGNPEIHQPRLTIDVINHSTINFCVTDFLFFVNLGLNIFLRRSMLTDNVHAVFYSSKTDFFFFFWNTTFRISFDS